MKNNFIIAVQWATVSAFLLVSQAVMAQRPVIMSTMPLVNQRVVTRFNLGNFERMRQNQHALSCLYMQDCVPEYDEESGVKNGAVASDEPVTRGQLAPCLPAYGYGLLPFCISPCINPGGFWFENYGDFVTQQARYPGMQGFHADSYGLNFGYDMLKDSQSVFGVAVGGAFSETEALKTDQKSETESFLVSLYGGTKIFPWHVQGSLGYVNTDFETDRASAGGVARLLGKHEGDTVFGSFEISRADLQQSCNMTPFLSYDFIRMEEDAFAERATAVAASGEALRYEKRKSTSYLQTLGVRYEKSYYEAGGWLVQSSMSAGWLHDYGQRRTATTVLSGSPYRYRGTAMNKNRLAVGLGIAASLGDSISLFTRYDGEFNRHFNAQTAQFGFGLGY